jgi:hypothetical protein
MRAKLKNARAYVLVAYAAILAVAAGIAVASVTKLRARARIPVAFLAILLATATPGIANASTTIALTTHGGTWSIATPFSFTQSNARYTTHTTVSGCVNAQDLVGTLGWHFRIIWYNGGRNTVLWSSREFSAGGNRCSPTLELDTHLPSVYSQETLDCNNPIPLPCTADGTWSLVTN